MKIVINTKYGGFNLSYAGVMKYAKLSGLKLNAYVNKRDSNGNINFNEYRKYNGKGDELLIYYSTGKLNSVSEGYFSARDIQRNDKNLVAVVEQLGEKANSKFSKLKVVEIPDDVKWTIEEYDGIEWVTEEHRTWR